MLLPDLAIQFSSFSRVLLSSPLTYKDRNMPEWTVKTVVFWNIFLFYVTLNVTQKSEE